MNLNLHITKALFFILLNLYSRFSFANENWYHIPLRSQEQISIMVDYQFINGAYEPHHQQLYHFVDNLWLNIYTNEVTTLNKNDSVNAIFHIYRNQKAQNNNENWILDTSINITLFWNGQNFTGQMKGIDQFGYYTTRFPIYSVGAFGEYEYRQEITFYVNKNETQFPLIDPINHSPHFKLELYKRVLEQGIQ